MSARLFKYFDISPFYYFVKSISMLFRMDRMTRVMDEKRYLEFCRARAVSFKGKYSQWFQSK